MKSLSARGLLVWTLVAAGSIWVATTAQGRGRSVKGVVAHPSQLKFERRPFEVPDGDAFRHLLPSGVVVYVAEDHSLPLVEVTAALRAGAWLDPPEQVGLASLTAAMMRRGGAGELAADLFDERVDFLGAEMRAVAGNSRSGASLDCASWVLDEALDRFFDMLAWPRFEPASLTLAKGNLNESLRHRNDDPLSVLGREWGRLIYGEDHFITRDLTPATLAAIQPVDLAAFHRRYWRPEQMVFAVSGDVDSGPILERLERHIAAWIERAGPPPPAPAWPPPAPTHRPRAGLYHLERDIPQAKIAMGHLGAVRERWDSAEFFALTVMNELLGGGELVSRIGGRLRTVEGLAYRARSRFEVGDHWPGDFQVSLDTANPTAALSVKLTLEEIERLQRRAPGGEELQRVKRSLTSVFPLLFDSASEIAGYFAEDELIGRPHRFWREYRANIKKVTAEEVRRAAQTYLHPDRMLIVIAGRWKELAAGDSQRRATMAEFYDGQVIHLPRRDPLTLKAVNQR